MENKKVTLKNKIIDQIKSVPTPVLVAAAVLPAGSVALVGYLIAKNTLNLVKRKKNG